MGRSTSTKTTEAESQTDIYQRVTDRIGAAIEAGLAEGKAGMPWHRKSHGGTATGLPMNAASKTSYRGVNVPVLWATADAAGYGTGLWATYEQWGEMGGQVRKGEQGTPVVYWKITKPSERGDTDGEDKAAGGKRGSFRSPPARHAACRATTNTGRKIRVYTGANNEAPQDNLASHYAQNYGRKRPLL